MLADDMAEERHQQQHPCLCFASGTSTTILLKLVHDRHDGVVAAVFRQVHDKVDVD